MRLICRILSGAVLLVSSLCAGEVYIIGTADLHGSLHGLASLAPEIRRYPDAVKVDAGDLLQGDFAVTGLRGAPMIEAMNYLQYDVWVPGNHEFEFDGADFRCWSRSFGGVILGAQWTFDGFVPAKSTVIRRNGFRIGIIGLGESRMAEKVRFCPGLSWRSNESALSDALDALAKADCHAIVLVCHIAVQGSYGELFGLLKRFPEIDAVISAHSHREHRGEIISGRLVAQPGERGRSAVLLKLHFDDDGEMVHVSSRLLRPGGGRDARIVAIAERAEAQMRTAGEKFYGNYADAESFGAAAAAALRRGSGADVAVVSFNEKYFSTPMTGRNLFRLFPFGNRLVEFEIALPQLRRIVRKYDVPPRRWFLSTGETAGKEVVKVVMTDYSCMRIPELKDVRIRLLRDFERETIAGELEKSLSGTIL